MTTFLLIAIFCSASLSLLSYVYCWHDIRGGHPHIISLRQITSVMDRNRLDHIFGKHETGYYYTLTPTQLYKLIQDRRWFYTSECAADSLCILGVWMYMTGMMEGDNVAIFIALSGICQGINLGYSLWLISKWRFQLREEIESSED